MPKFFIHSRRGGKIARDAEGQDLPGLEAALAAATASMRELLANEIRNPKGQTLEAMIIEDEDAQEIITFHAKEILPEQK